MKLIISILAVLCFFSCQALAGVPTIVAPSSQLVGLSYWCMLEPNNITESAPPECCTADYQCDKYIEPYTTAYDVYNAGKKRARLCRCEPHFTECLIRKKTPMSGAYLRTMVLRSSETCLKEKLTFPSTIKYALTTIGQFEDSENNVFEEDNMEPNAVRGILRIQNSRRKN